MPPWRALVRACGVFIVCMLHLPASSSRRLAGGANLLPASDEKVQWIGRTVVEKDGSVVIDWPATSAVFTVSNASFVSVTLVDGTNGTRLAVMAVRYVIHSAPYA
jgi:hypothetical protein